MVSSSCGCWFVAHGGPQITDPQILDATWGTFLSPRLVWCLSELSSATIWDNSAVVQLRMDYLEVLEVFVEKGTPEGHKITIHGKAAYEI